jgi:hypothetical protein
MIFGPYPYSRPFTSWVDVLKTKNFRKQGKKRAVAAVESEKQKEKNQVCLFKIIKKLPSNFFCCIPQTNMVPTKE